MSAVIFIAGTYFWGSLEKSLEISHIDVEPAKISCYTVFLKALITRA